MKITLVILFLVLCSVSFVWGSLFREYPIGESVEMNQMEVGAVWLPPMKVNLNDIRNLGKAQSRKNIDTERKIRQQVFLPYILRKKRGGQEIHIEADIHAIEGNRNGFGVGEWVPFLKVSYVLKGEAGRTISGKFVPMVAKDGPHYGAQIFLPFGKYKLTYKIEPPDSRELGRHIDSVTGVAEWWKPFNVTFDFDFRGVKR